MEITVEELLAGKSTIIKNKEFFPTKNYIEPFFDKMSKYTDKFIIRAKAAPQMSITQDSTDIVWNRVWVQAQLPESYDFDNHSEVYGIVMGLDARKPVAKLYRGGLNLACMNLTVFNPSWLNVQELQPDEPLNFNPLEELAQKENDMRITIERMKNEFLDRDKAKDHLGHWVDFSILEGEDNGFGNVKMATSVPISAYKQIFLDKDHKYYSPEGIDPSKFDVYNAFTELITHDKRDILNTAEKTLLLGRMLNVSNN